MGNGRVRETVGEGPREEGAPSDRRTDREGARLGRQRTTDDIPVQGTTSPIAVVASYIMGAPNRPNITFDNGFLDQFAPRAPTVGDRLELAKWRAIVEGAEVLRPDLVDGIAAYRHFLDGNGRPRTFSYERYARADTSGRTSLRNAILSIQWGVQQLWTAFRQASFSLTGTAISCGDGNLFPYPATENWQKAIGGHVIWLSGAATVDSSGADPAFSVEMTLHAEDRYNFNPGAADIATGAPDSSNGIFEVTGLAHQYDQTSTLQRSVRWTGIGVGVGSSSGNTDRERQPGDGRRLRSRI